MRRLTYLGIVVSVVFAASCGGSSSRSEDEVISAMCIKQYEQGVGNASTSERDSWIADCVSECELPEWRQQCLAVAKQIGA